MTVRRWGILVLVLGLVVAAHGLIVIMANQPEKFDGRKSQANALGDVGNWFGVQSRNAERIERRHSASREMQVGALAAIAGLVLVGLGRGRAAGTGEMPSRGPAGAAGDPPRPRAAGDAPPAGGTRARFCMYCGGALPPGANFCPTCAAPV